MIGWFELGAFAVDTRVNAENCCDFLRVFVNGVEVTQVTTSDWTRQQFTLQAGINRIRFEFSKDWKSSGGEDAAMIDNVSFVADSDQDGLSNSWESANGLDPFDAADAGLDPDGDSLSNIDEYGAGTNPQASDSDADGMPDGWEVSNSLNPLVNDANGDPDGDGSTNFQEYQAGTNPNAAPLPPPPPPTKKGGGGGGSADPTLVMLLLLFVILRNLERRRRHQSTPDVCNSSINPPPSARLNGFSAGSAWSTCFWLSLLSYTQRKQL